MGRLPINTRHDTPAIMIHSRLGAYVLCVFVSRRLREGLFEDKSHFANCTVVGPDAVPSESDCDGTVVCSTMWRCAILAYRREHNR